MEKQLKGITMEAAYLNMSNVVAKITPLGVVHRHRRSSDCRLLQGQYR
jgi:hypothetical protein